MMATSETKLYAQFKTATQARGDVIEIQEVQDAVEYGFKNHWGSFQTYEITTVDLNGEFLKSEPQNRSGTHYLKVDKIMTAADIAATYAAEVGRLGPLVQQEQEDLKKIPCIFRPASYKDNDVYHQAQSKLVRDKMSLRGSTALRDHFNALSSEVLFFKVYGEYHEIEKDDVLFDRSGRQIYPQPGTPGAKPAATAEKQQKCQTETRARKLKIKD